MKKDIDLDYEIPEKPLAGRKHISILIGAGFSAPQGYPIGNTLNENILNFEKYNVDFSPSGVLCSLTTGEKPAFQEEGILNQHQKHFVFCKRLIKKYTETHKFDYEEFYDFIKSEEVYNSCYETLCEDLLDEYTDYGSFVFSLPDIYNQMVRFLLRDKDGNSFYENQPFHIGFVEHYDGFLKYLSHLKEDNIIDVHTLNHDLLFESFNKTEYINGSISDGFDEYGSEFYGILNRDNATYHCRLERYTARYDAPIRLYKLHGSLDYVPYYKTVENNFMIPIKYVKIREGIGVSDLLRGIRSKMGYESCPIAYHADFLTGTTSKIERYNNPLLFKKLFKRFRKNLRNAEKLIIIGYGCKDEGINKMILENFDFAHKSTYIFDKYAGDKVRDFGKKLSAKVIDGIEIEDIVPEMFQ